MIDERSPLPGRFSHRLTPKHVNHAEHVEPPEYSRRFEEADLIISHAGMGTILTALIKNKPLLALPRIAPKGEHRNEHQHATAKHLRKINYIQVAENENHLIEILNSPNGINAKPSNSKYAG